jgi:hypothetical protein
MALVDPYLKQHSPELYTLHVVSEVGKRTFQKIKHRKPHIKMPDVEISVGRWTAGQSLYLFIFSLSYCGLAEWSRWVEINDPRMFDIPLIVNVEGQSLSILRECKKFLRDLPPDVGIAGVLPLSPLSSPSLTPSRDLPPRKKVKKDIAQVPRCDQGLALLPVKRHVNDGHVMSEIPRKQSRTKAVPQVGLSSPTFLC